MGHTHAAKRPNQVERHQNKTPERIVQIGSHTNEELHRNIFVPGHAQLHSQSSIYPCTHITSFHFSHAPHRGGGGGSEGVGGRRIPIQTAAVTIHERRSPPHSPQCQLQIASTQASWEPTNPHLCYDDLLLFVISPSIIQPFESGRTRPECWWWPKTPTMPHHVNWGPGYPLRVLRID